MEAGSKARWGLSPRVVDLKGRTSGLIAVLLLLVLVGAIRCRFTVRDIGFVDLHGPRYELVVVAKASVKLSGSVAEKIGRVKDAGNVVARMVDPDLNPEHPAVRFLGAEVEDGRVHGILLGPSQDPLRLGSFGPEDIESGVDQLISAALASPARDAILQQALDTFAFFILLEGEDAKENERMVAALDSAERSLSLLSSQLPRPIEHPLRRIRLPPAPEGEKVLLWSLGLQSDQGLPAVCVLYGRGKLAGSVLLGKEIEDREILSQLALVGESCECDTDRDWVNEPNIPMEWGAMVRKRAPSMLGFDPESPMVRSEVLRIIGRGRIEGGGTDADRDDLETLIFGYREAEVGEGVGSGGELSEPSEPTLDEELYVLLEGDGGDWEFEKEKRAQAVDAQGAPVSVKEMVSRTNDPGDGNDADNSNSIRSVLFAAALVALVSCLGAAFVFLRRKAG